MTLVVASLDDGDQRKWDPLNNLENSAALVVPTDVEINFLCLKKGSIDLD